MSDISDCEKSAKFEDFQQNRGKVTFFPSAYTFSSRLPHSINPDQPQDGGLTRLTGQIAGFLASRASR